MWFAKLKNRLFPCEKVMKRLMENHAVSMQLNQEAHERLISACKIDPRSKECQRLPNIAFIGR